MRKENKSKSIGRRQFLGSTAAGGLAVMSARLVRGSEANSAPRLGLLGCGGRGTAVASGFVNDTSARVTALADLPEAALGGVVRSVRETNRLVHCHHETRFDGPVLHVQAARDHAGTGLEPGLWAPFAGAVEVVPLPCLHGTLLAPEVRPALVAALDGAMRAVVGDMS